MELYKVTVGFNKKFYESKKVFERHWPNNVRYCDRTDVIAYKIDWKEQEWRCIRRVGPTINYHSE